MTNRRRLHLAAVAATLLVVTTSGCGRPGSEAALSTCESAVSEASQALEVDQQIAQLDVALVRCRSVSELGAQLAEHPDIIGYDLATFIDVRCHRVADELIRTAPVCASVIAPATTAPPASTEIVFVGETLDGRKVRIVPDADTPFVGDVPAVIQQTVDIAIESGCPGVFAQRDLWAAQIADPAIGDEASVYARHAANVAAYIGCEAPPATAVATTAAG